MKTSFCLALLASVVVTTAAAQAPAGPPTLSTSIKRMQDGVARNLRASADKVSEELFAFQPTKEVRTFGQLVGHLANANFNYCARGKGETNPNTQDFEKLTKKADLAKALDDSLKYCDAVYASLTDQSAIEVIKMGQNDGLRVTPLISNISHNNEHYGNLVTYMRLKGIVPPSSEPAPARPSGR